jgi:subtilisin family serine protease
LTLLGNFEPTSQGATTVHKRGLIYAAVLAATVSATAALPATAQASQPSGKQETPRTVTLITGDKVTVTKTGDTWDARIEPAKRIGDRVRFIKSVSPRGVTVIPSIAEPLIRSGKLDRALFDVTKLIELGYDDAHTAEIPLLVESSGAKTLGKVTRELPKVRMSAVATPKAKAVDLFANAANTRIWLNGKAFPSLDVSVPQVGGPAAWQAGFTGAGAKIAVLDTGYDAKHPDLAGIVKGEKDFLGEPSGMRDEVGHGTHVASTAAGRGAKYTGVAKGADLLIGKVCSFSGCPFDAILEGMQWAADSGARVVNMSLGGGPGDGTDPIETAINRISAETGTLFVVAAGNYGPRSKVASPAAADAALAVASVNKQDQFSSFSQPGPRIKDYAVKPDIAAPGEAIVAARAEGTLDDVAVDEHYARLDGTSMATPHVAGAAAIVAAQHPDWTGQQIKAALMASAHPINATVYQQGAGRLDVGRAVKQTIIPSTGSLSLGFVKFPHNQPALSKQVTYRNTGTAPVTLALSLDVPAFRTDVNQVTVPAGGQSTVTVSFDHATAQVGEYGGRLVATSGETVIQTSVGAYKEPESYDLTMKMIDRNGTELPAGAGGAIWVDLDVADDVFDMMASNSPVRLPAGKYAVFGAVETAVPGQVQPTSTSAAEPEVDLRKDTVVTLDARKGNKVSVQTEEKDARRAAGNTAMVIETGGRGVGYFSESSDDDYAAPTTTNSSKFKYYNRQQIERPLVKLAVSKPESFDVPVTWAPNSPQTTDVRALSAVDVGHATPAELAAKDVKGKLAVFTLGASEALEFDARVQAIAAAGGAAGLFYFSERTSILARDNNPIPVVYTLHPAAARLAKLANPSVTLTGQTASPYRYELAFPHHGGIPANVTYRPRNHDLATVKANYRAHVEGGVGYLDFGTRDGDLRMDEGLWSTVIPVPLERTEYYSPVTWQVSFRVSPSRDHGPEAGFLNTERAYKPGEKTSVDWNKAAIGPSLAVSNERYNGVKHLVYRNGDTITASLPLFSDSAGHTGYPSPEEYSFADKGDTVLSANGKEIGRSGIPGEGTFTVPAGRGDYRLTSSVERNHPVWPLSTKVSAEWGFKSAHVNADTPLPLLTIGFDPKLDRMNYAPGGALFAIPVRVDRQPGTSGGRTDLNKVEVSYNDGQSWTQVPLLQVNGTWWAGVQHRSSGFVSLRASASDSDGNTVTQTIIRAYRVK